MNGFCYLWTLKLTYIYMLRFEKPQMYFFFLFFLSLLDRCGESCSRSRHRAHLKAWLLLSDLWLAKKKKKAASLTVFLSEATRVCICASAVVVAATAVVLKLCVFYRDRGEKERSYFYELPHDSKSGSFSLSSLLIRFC